MLLVRHGARGRAVSTGPLVRGSATAQRTAAATFDPAALEAKWQARWAGEGVPEAHAPDRADWPKYYALSMFPYPSGANERAPVAGPGTGDRADRRSRAQATCTWATSACIRLATPSRGSSA